MLNSTQTVINQMRRVFGNVAMFRTRDHALPPRQCSECGQVRQDGQCTCNVTLRHVHETIVAMEMQYYILLCVYVWGGGDAPARVLSACANMRAAVCDCGCTGAGVCLRSCSLTTAACNAYAPYCHLRPVWLYHIFRHCLINGTIFEKKKSYRASNVYVDFFL